jgi:hypothetical protein
MPYSDRQGRGHIVSEVPVIATVECRSEGSGEQRPVAVRLGGDLIEVVEILLDSVIGTVEAGGVNRRDVVVVLADGQHLSLRRKLPDGDWRVYRAAEHPPSHPVES